jgi:hypothetical protein
MLHAITTTTVHTLQQAEQVMVVLNYVPHSLRRHIYEKKNTRSSYGS